MEILPLAPDSDPAAMPGTEVVRVSIKLITGAVFSGPQGQGLGIPFGCECKDTFSIQNVSGRAIKIGISSFF